MKRISITVKPNSKFEKVEEDFDGGLKVWLKEPAKEGKANKRLFEVLSDYYNIPKSQITIKSGLTSKRKIIEVS